MNSFKVIYFVFESVVKEDQWSSKLLSMLY